MASELGLLSIMEAERKRMPPAGDWEGKRRNSTSREDAGNPRSSGGTEEVVLPPAVDGDVEEEVEEFFAILRRMHAATRQFGGDRATEAGGRRMLRSERAEGTSGIHRWRPAFDWEDFEEGRRYKLPKAGDAGSRCARGEVESATSEALAAVGHRGKREEKSAAIGTAVCLDPNTEPEPDGVVG